MQENVRSRHGHSRNKDDKRGKQGAWSSSRFRTGCGKRRRCLPLFCLPEFLWHFRVTEFLRVEIRDVNAHAVFHFAFTESMQVRLPVSVVLQIIGDTF